MLTIHRYRLPIVDSQTLDLPRGATLLHVDSRPWNPIPELDLWAQVDTDQPDEPRNIRIVGTGHPLNPDAVHSYIGTVLLPEQRLVFHAYEIHNSSADRA